MARFGDAVPGPNKPFHVQPLLIIGAIVAGILTSVTWQFCFRLLSAKTGHQDYILGLHPYGPNYYPGDTESAVSYYSYFSMFVAMLIGIVAGTRAAQRASWPGPRGTRVFQKPILFGKCYSLGSSPSPLANSFHHVTCGLRTQGWTRSSRVSIRCSPVCNLGLLASPFRTCSSVEPRRRRGNPFTKDWARFSDFPVCSNTPYSVRRSGFHAPGLLACWSRLGLDSWRLRWRSLQPRRLPNNKLDVWSILNAMKRS